MKDWWGQAAGSRPVRWLVMTWLGVLGLLLAGVVVWFLLQLAVVALLVAVPVAGVAAVAGAVRGWLRRQRARRAGHELVEVKRVCSWLE